MNGKQKGSAFEREVCKKLSLWVTGGKQKDVFWRSAMSGGRATRDKDVRQAGDITAVAPEGHILTDNVYIECKHYKDLNLASFLLEGRGVLAQFWRKTCTEAVIRGKIPCIIAKQNAKPTLFITRPEYLFGAPQCVVVIDQEQVEVWKFADVLEIPFGTGTQHGGRT